MLTQYIREYICLEGNKKYKIAKIKFVVFFTVVKKAVMLMLKFI